MIDEGFIKFQRSRGMSWGAIGGMLGVSASAAEGRFRSGQNADVRRAIWAEYGPDAEALVAMLKSEGRPGMVLAVYMITLQRHLAAMAPKETREALEAADPTWPKPRSDAQELAPVAPRLRPLPASGRGPGVLQALAEAVAKDANITVDELINGGREPRLTSPRWRFMAEATEARYTTTEVGAFLGCDRSTVSYGRKHHLSRQAIRA